MKAVFSFWTAPKPVHRYDLERWLFSVLLARQWFPAVELHACARGRGVLEAAGVPFDSVVDITSGDLEGVPRGYWAVSKLVAVSKQEGDFVHLDEDVLLTGPLNLREAPAVYTQCPDDTDGWGAYYEECRAKLPGPLRSRLTGRKFHGYNCGVLGASGEVPFMRKFAEESLAAVREAARYDKSIKPMICCEQALLDRMAEEEGVSVKPVFASREEMAASRRDYFHLTSTKYRSGVQLKVRKMLRERFPKEYAGLLRRVDDAIAISR